MEPYFFLSYARVDNQDAYVQRFHQDLCRAVVDRATSCPSDVDGIGFRDNNDIELGHDWQQRLEESLRWCGSLVALYSPRYFASDFCGREWTVFYNRLLLHEADTGTLPPALLPVVWEPFRKVPETVARIQYLREEFGEEYVEFGLRHLIRLAPRGDAYSRVLSVLAERIVLAAESFRVPRAEPFDLQHVTGLFGGTRRTAPPQVAGGAQHVRFLVATGTDGDLPPERTRREYYGAYPNEWRPYLPAQDTSLPVLAQAVVSQRKCTSSVDILDESQLSMLRRALEHNAIVILLVDAWAATMSHYHNRLRDYDGMNQPTTGVLVPWNDLDPETRSHWERLERTLQQTFLSNSTRRDDLFQLGVPSGLLDATLTRMVTEAQSRLYSSGQVRRRPHGDPPIERPVLGS